MPPHHPRGRLPGSPRPPWWGWSDASRWDPSPRERTGPPPCGRPGTRTTWSGRSAGHEPRSRGPGSGPRGSGVSRTTNPGGCRGWERCSWPYSFSEGSGVRWRSARCPCCDRAPMTRACRTTSVDATARSSPRAPHRGREGCRSASWGLTLTLVTYHFIVRTRRGGSQAGTHRSLRAVLRAAVRQSTLPRSSPEILVQQSRLLDVYQPIIQRIQLPIYPSHGSPILNVAEHHSTP